MVAKRNYSKEDADFSVSQKRTKADIVAQSSSWTRTPSTFAMIGATAGPGIGEAAYRDAFPAEANQALGGTIWDKDKADDG